MVEGNLSFPSDYAGKPSEKSNYFSDQTLQNKIRFTCNVVSVMRKIHSLVLARELFLLTPKTVQYFIRTSWLGTIENLIEKKLTKK